jgi:hypothetical protein
MSESQNNPFEDKELKDLMTSAEQLLPNFKAASAEADTVTILESEFRQFIPLFNVKAQAGMDPDKLKDLTTRYYTVIQNGFAALNVVDQSGTVVLSLPRLYTQLTTPDDPDYLRLRDVAMRDHQTAPQYADRSERAMLNTYIARQIESDELIQRIGDNTKQVERQMAGQTGQTPASDDDSDGWTIL